jgi:hypothetical protein
MTKGKAWTIQEEKQLKQMLNANKSVREIANELRKTPDCIHMKMSRLGLKEVVVENTQTPSTTNKLILPAELPSIEEQLKVLSAALKALTEPGLNQYETLRLRAIIQGVKAYKELFEEYIDYRGIESEVAELTKELAKERMEKTKNMAPS